MVTEHWPPVLRGSSAAVTRARAAFSAAAAASLPTLIVAERGLEPETIVRALHDRSRPGQPLLVIDCAGPEGDVEQQLFGIAPRGTAQGGLVTVGAQSALLRARTGSLYLKQILELPAALQRRLARVLRDREVMAARRRVRVTARVIADVPPSATFDQADGSLRGDLFRRLSQARVEIPALRERVQDVREMAEGLAEQLTGHAAPPFTQAALTVLAAPAWPGNLDELRGVLDRVLRGTASGAVRQEDVLAQLPIDGTFARIAPEVSLREARKQFERQYIASVLERHRWRMSEAARTLGIERANLYRKTRQLGIQRHSPRTSVAS